MGKVLLCLAVLLMLAIAAQANSNDRLTVHGHEHGHEHDDDPKFDRSITVVKKQGKDVELRSRRRDDDSKEEFRFSINTKIEQGIELKLGYKSKSSDGDSTMLGFRVVCRDVIFYEEANNVPGFQKDEDTEAAGGFKIGTAQGWDIDCDPTENGHECTGARTDNKFSIKVVIVQNVTDVEGAPLRPTSIKFTANIDKPTASYVALGCKVKTKSNFKYRSKSKEEEEGLTSKPERSVVLDGLAFFSWVTKYTIDNTELTLVNSGLENDEEHTSNSEAARFLVFSFPTDKTGTIVWDPKLGFGEDGSNSLASSASFSLALFVTVLLAYVASLF